MTHQTQIIFRIKLNTHNRSNRGHDQTTTEDRTLRAVRFFFFFFFLTVVGEAAFAETHEQVLLDFVRGHEFGADGAVEPWEGDTEDTEMMRTRDAAAPLA